MSTKGLWIFGVAMLLSAMMVTSFSTPVSADEKQDSIQLVDKSRMTLEAFMADKNMEAFRDLIKQAKAILVTPQLLKGAFVVGASGGSGVLMVRDEKIGQWNGPSFYTLGGASFGLQIGGQASEVILLAMTERGVTSFLSNSFKLGADVGLAAGPIGVGASAASANLSADILSFARSKGLYGGISLDGSVVAVRGGLNEAYYSKKCDPADIFVRQNVANPHSAGLKEAIVKITAKK
jgi:lipid-binding SYLF domain-containing protein